MQMLRYVYTKQLPPDITQQDLLQLCMLADRYQVPECQKACTLAVCNINVAQLEWATVVWALDAPPALQLLDGYSDFLALAQRRIIKDLGDLEVVYANPALIDTLLELPFAGILYLLSSSETTVAYETTAVSLVTMWMDTHEEVETVTLDQQKQLAQQIRFTGLPPTYVATAIPKVRWMTRSMTTVEMLQAAALSQLDEATRLKAGKELAAFTGSANWLRSVRSKSSKQCVEFDCEVSESDLKHTFDQRNTPFRWQSDSHKFGGYEFHACINFVKVPEVAGKEQEWSLFVGLGFRMPDVLGRDVYLNVKQGVITHPKSGKSHRCSGKGMLRVDHSRGWNDFLGVSMTAWEPQKLAVYMEGGKLKMHVKVDKLL
eukprot:jgi/Chrzof1/1504/Cz10g10090.t1